MRRKAARRSSAPALPGQRRALTDRALLAMLLAYPLMTVKVVAAIHYEAVRLMLKGVRRHQHVARTPAA